MAGRDVCRRELLGAGLAGIALTPTGLLASGQISPAKVLPAEGPWPSLAPRYQFAETLEEQEAQLATNPHVRRFSAARRAQAHDPYRPGYHFVSPESRMNDPVALTYWQGRWHLFYLAYPLGEPRELGNFLGHAVSEDLLHWRDLPYALHPGIEAHISTGRMLVETNRVITFYPGRKTGMMIATSSDPLLLNWTKSGPVMGASTALLPSAAREPFSNYGDSDIWKEGDVYVGLIGGVRHYYPEESTSSNRKWKRPSFYSEAFWPKFTLWTSKDLKTWSPAGDLLFQNTPFTDRYDDGACPNFRRIGSKHIMIFFSHINGSQYLLGNYDPATRRFRPYDHGRFNHGEVTPGGVLAPAAVEDGEGGLINILTFATAKKTGEWDELMSIPQRLTLDGDQRLRITPLESVATLRRQHQRVGSTAIPLDREIVLGSIRGNTVEIDLEIDPKQSHWVQLNVLRSPDAEEQTSITFYNRQTKVSNHDGGQSEEVVLDGSRSSRLSDVRLRPPERARVDRDGEHLKLRVFIDRSVIEVFVNNRQYLAMRVYPGRKDSVGVSLRTHGGDAILHRLDAWQMQPIFSDSGGRN